MNASFGMSRKNTYKMTNIKRMDEDDEEEIVSPKNLFSISHMQVSTNHFIVRLHEHIDAASNYANLFNLFDNAGEDDNVIMDICSPGGSLDTCILIRRAIMKSPSLITARIGPTCSSAAGAIALAADAFEIDSDSSFMVHNANLGMGRMKMSDLYASATHSKRQIEHFIRTTYKHFLSDDEIEKVLEGKEYYFDSSELGERLGHLIHERHKEMLETMGHSEECDEDCDSCEEFCKECEEDDEYMS
jgi:ATP-dependent protease ClpP protease subunit